LLFTAGPLEAGPKIQSLKAWCIVTNTPRTNRLQGRRHPARSHPSILQGAFLDALAKKCAGSTNDHDRVTLPLGRVPIGEVRQVLTALRACAESAQSEP
jgi:hypothetical protein